MSDSLQAHDGFVNEGGDFVVMARVVGLDNANIVQADVTSAVVKVYKTNIDPTLGEDGDSDPEETYDSGALTVSAFVFDTLQTDARWTKDSTGYNVRLQIPATATPDGDEHYAVELVLTMADAAVSIIPVTWGVFARRLFSL